MSKNVVLCLDGTSNQFGQHNTNVVKLFRVLMRDADEQLAFYDPGVGTLADPTFKTPIGKKVNAALGLAFGRGLTRNISEAYSYLMENYEDGDRILVFGFSRGAYTARALAGFIHRCGLLDRGCQNLIAYAMKLFKAADFETCARFKKTYSRTCTIHLLGLWDTVTTYGWVYDPKSLPNTTNNESVHAVRHAIAIDERRVYFRQNHWGREHIERQDVKEVWFAGVHGDIGGGYPESESGLAKGALEWMIDEARADFGLQIDQNTLERVVLGRGGDYVPPDPMGLMHTSLKGSWRGVEFLPQRVYDWELGRRKFRLPQPARPRPVLDGAVLHHSVLDRLNAGNYQPANLQPLETVQDRFVIEQRTKQRQASEENVSPIG